MAVDQIVLAEPFPVIRRLILGVAGLFVLVAAPFELHRGLWPVTFATPIFAVIVFGGGIIGAVFLFGALFSPEDRFAIGPNAIIVERVRPLRPHRRYVLARGTVAEITLTETEWDSRPNSFGLRLRLTAGDILHTPEIGSREAAETLRERLVALLC